jgi:cell division protein FtsB
MGGDQRWRDIMKGFIKCVLFITGLMLGALGILVVLDGPSAINWTLLSEAIADLIIGLILAMPILVICIIVKIIKRIIKKANKRLPRYYKSKFSTDFTLKLSKENDQLKEQIKQLEETIKMLEESRKTAITDFYQARELSDKLTNNNEWLKEKNWELTQENWALKREIKDLKLAKDIITNTNKKTIQTKQDMKEQNIKNPKMFKINLTPISENKMYETSDREIDKLRRTNYYNRWIKDFHNQKLPSLKQLNVNINKPMKIYMYFAIPKKTYGYDVTNCHKALIDQVAAHYGFDDKMISCYECVGAHYVDDINNAFMYFSLENETGIKFK